MNIRELEDKAWLAHNFTWPNRRGAYQPKTGGYITYGLPPPPSGRREKDDEMKGSDRIGFTEVVITPEMVGKTVAIFTGVELKTVNDRLAPGQIRFHNFVLEHGGISEIWRVLKSGEIEIIKERI